MNYTKRLWGGAQTGLLLRKLCYHPMDILKTIPFWDYSNLMKLLDSNQAKGYK